MKQFPPGGLVEALYELQRQGILHLQVAEKLNAKHIQRHKHKMKVSDCDTTQTLSASVAAAVTFLQNIRVENFISSKATSDFILLINNLFDLLYLRTIFGKQYKAPINLGNYAGWSSSSGWPEKDIYTRFCNIPANSVLAISKDLLQRSNLPYKYIITYR